MSDTARWKAAKEKVLDGFESYDGVEGDGVVDALIAEGDSLADRVDKLEAEVARWKEVSGWRKHRQEALRARVEALTEAAQRVVDSRVESMQFTGTEPYRALSNLRKVLAVVVPVEKQPSEEPCGWCTPERVCSECRP